MWSNVFSVPLLLEFPLLLPGWFEADASFDSPAAHPICAKWAPSLATAWFMKAHRWRYSPGGRSMSSSRRTVASDPRFPSALLPRSWSESIASALLIASNWPLNAASASSPMSTTPAAPIPPEMPVSSCYPRSIMFPNSSMGERVHAVTSNVYGRDASDA